ncbi:hypothetical protein ABPG72_020834 [Tetrahymena utriculariae]
MFNRNLPNFILVLKLKGDSQYYQNLIKQSSSVDIGSNKTQQKCIKDLVKQQAKIISQYSLKKQANESIYLEQNELMQLVEQLFHNKCYNKSFEAIFCSYGIVIATKNKKILQEVYEFDRFSCSLKKYLQQSFYAILGSLTI